MELKRAKVGRAVGKNHFLCILLKIVSLDFFDIFHKVIDQEPVVILGAHRIPSKHLPNFDTILVRTNIKLVSWAVYDPFRRFRGREMTIST